jgi:excisionase family DNA binding protein
MTQTIQTHIPTMPDIVEAKEILQALRPDSQSITMELSGQEFTLPQGLSAMLRDILTNTAKGQAITILPYNTEFSSQEAADYLHVSRQFLVNEADAGRIQYRRIGSHRRFAFEEILKYQHLTELESLAARQALTDQAQELGLDDW